MDTDTPTSGAGTPPAPEDRPEDRPAHARRVLLRPWTYRLLERYCEGRETDLAEETNRAVREMLEREGKWNPPAGARD